MGEDERDQLIFTEASTHTTLYIIKMGKMSTASVSLKRKVNKEKNERKTRECSAVRSWGSH